MDDYKNKLRINHFFQKDQGGVASDQDQNKIYEPEYRAAWNARKA